MVQALDRLKSATKLDLAWWSVIALGIVLRLRQYLADRSLWGDEASLAVNLVDRSLFGLTQKLGFHQAAPLGFLFIEKFSIILLGNADYILRLFPFISGIAALYLMYRIARDNFGAAGLFALLMFSINHSLIYYASELKQYSSDVTITLLLVYLAIKCLGENARMRDFQWLGIAGMITIWVSHISIFILAGIGLTLVLDELMRKRYTFFAWNLAAGTAWLVSFGVEYLVALRYTALDPHFQTAWQTNFLPLPPWIDLHWFVKTGYFFLFILMTRTDRILAFLVSVLIYTGIYSLVLRRRGIALIVLLSLMTTLAASALHKYPLSYRFMLFLIPFALLLMAEGVGRIHTWMAKWQRSLAIILGALPVIALLWFSVPNAYDNLRTPETISEIKPIMKYVGENREPQDRIYLYYGAVPGFRYYAPFYEFDDLSADRVVEGVWRQNESKAFERFFEDVQGLKGKGRVWFIFVEIVDCGGCEGDKQLVFTDYLDQYGTRLDSIRAVQSAAYLYDLAP